MATPTAIVSVLLLTYLAASRHLVSAARSLRSAGRTADAEALYREVVTSRPEDVAVLRELTELLVAQERPGDAREFLLSALSKTPDAAWIHHAFAQVGAGADYLGRVWLSELGPTPPTLEAAADALADVSSSGHARLLGHLLLASGQPARAAEAYAALGPPGTALQGRAWRYAGHSAKADGISGCVHVREGDFTRGEALLRRTTECGAGTAEVYAHLVVAVEQRHAYDDALAIAREGLRASPGDTVLQRSVPRLLLKMNQTAEAQRTAARLGRSGSADARLDQMSLLGLPIVYGSADEVDASRDRFEVGLSRLEATADPDDLGRWGGLLLTNNSYLGYQARDDRVLQERTPLPFHSCTRHLTQTRALRVRLPKAGLMKIDTEAIPTYEIYTSTEPALGRLYPRGLAP